MYSGVEQWQKPVIEEGGIMAICRITGSKEKHIFDLKGIKTYNARIHSRTIHTTKTVMDISRI